MESALTIREAEQRKAEELKAQIAALQVQLSTVDPGLVDEPRKSTKRKEPEPKLLVPATPSPKKKRRVFDNEPVPAPRPKTSKPAPTQPAPAAAPGRSNLLSKLASTGTRSSAEESARIRSAGFAERPPTPPNLNIPKRDENLAIVDEVPIGPSEHKAPFDDPTFEKQEPNSGIRLSSRTLPHEDLQEHLRGRYYLSPSRLYSNVRLLPDKSSYDIPVEGDWVTIAVVAERGPVKQTHAPETVDRDDEGKPKRGQPPPPEKPRGKRFVTFTLVDFGARRASSATGGTAVIRGDALLRLILFEADSCDLIRHDDGRKPSKVYRGGSRGAFEALSKVKEGDVIALLNPRILKPFQRAGETPHPRSNVLAVTPENAASIAIIGRARDLGLCNVTKADGKQCLAWFDKRASEVCDYHVQQAVQRSRASRPEFTASTNGMSSSAKHQQKHTYDPRRRWGLQPEHDAGGATYVLAGHVVRGGGGDMFVGERVGRDAQAKAARAMQAKADKATLQALVKRDKEGMRDVIAAREAAERLKEKERAEREKDKKRKGKEMDKEADKGKAKGKMTEEARRAKEEEDAQDRPRYSADMIKNLGFDPSVKPGTHRQSDAAMQSKLDALSSLSASRKHVALGPRPGQPKVRSGVIAPKQELVALDSDDEDVDWDDSKKESWKERILERQVSATDS
ncbi:hypothetical protein HDZ31DRAFT_84606 [Schizophyllum fasciatum]